MSGHPWNEEQDQRTHGAQEVDSGERTVRVHYSKAGASAISVRDNYCESLGQRSSRLTLATVGGRRLAATMTGRRSVKGDGGN